MGLLMKNKREDVDDDDASSSRFYLLARTEEKTDENGENHEWYAIDDDKCSANEKESITPISGMGHIFRRGTKEMICVLDGTKICVLGGFNCHPYHVPFVFRAYDPEVDGDPPTRLAKDFWCFDVGGGVDSRWMQGPCMRWGRAESYVISYDGKIYVFGGEQTAGGSCNEVFDSSTKEWSPFLEDFSKENYIFKVVQIDRVVDETTGRKEPFFLFYVFNPGYLYAYNILTQECHILDHQFGSYFWDNNFVVTCNQNVLSILSKDDNLVWGYRIDRKEWSIVHGLNGKWVLPDVSKVPNSDRVVNALAYLFPIGKNGKLCLIWGFTYGYFKYHFHYTKFTVQQDGVAGLYAAQVEPVRSFHIDGIEEFNYCLTLDLHQKGAKKMKVSSLEPNTSSTNIE